MKLPYPKILLAMVCVGAMASNVQAQNSFSYTSFYDSNGYIPANATTGEPASYDLSSSFSTFGFRSGEAFTVGSQNILVTQLGAFAANSKTGPGSDPYGPNVSTTAGVTTTDIQNEVALYNLTTHSLVLAESVASGTVVDSDGFAYNPTPLTLTLVSGDEYAITTFAGLAGQPGSYYVPDYNGAPAGTFNVDAPATPYSRTYTPAAYGGSNTDTSAYGYEPGTHGIPLQSATDITFAGDTDDNNSGNINAIPGTPGPATAGGSVYNGIGGNLIYTVIPEPSDLAYMVIGGVVLFLGLRRKMAKNS